MTARKWIVQSLVTVAALAVLTRAISAQGPSNSLPPAAVVNGEAISMAEVEQVLKERGPSPTPVPEVQRRQMQLGALEMLIDDALMRQFLRKNGPKIDPADVSKRLAELEASLKKEGKTLQDFYRDTKQTEFQVRTDILQMLQWAEYVKNRFTEADVKRYYDEYKEFFDQVQVRASHIIFRLTPDASPGERQAARAKLLALRQEIVSGKLDFGEAAKKHSQCATAPLGGDVKYFTRKFAVEEPFAKAAFALKPGEISDIVETEYGLHLIKVTDRKPGVPSDFNKIKDDVREIYIEEMRQAMLAQQRKAAQIQINLK